MPSANALQDLLNGADQAHIEAAVRQVIAAATDFADETDLREQLIDAGVPPETLTDLQSRLEADPAALESAALAVLSLEWDDPDQRHAVEGAITEAKTKLPVIEVGMLSIVLIYAIHSHYTKGKRKEVVILRRDAAGNIETTTETEWADVSAPIRSIVDSINSGLPSQPGQSKDMPR